MNVLNKKMTKRTGAHGAPSAMVVSSVCHSISISKIVDFMNAGPVGSALFVFVGQDCALACHPRAGGDLKIFN